VTQVFTLPAHPSRSAWPLVVVASRQITPRMRRVSLIGEALDGFAHRPGQSLVLGLPQPCGGLARRHYAIRRFDREELRLDIDLVTHGVSPGVRWAQQAHIGDPVLSARVAAGVNLILTTVASFAALIPQTSAQPTLQKVARTQVPIPKASDLKTQWNQQVCGPTSNSALDFSSAGCRVR